MSSFLCLDCSRIPRDNKRVHDCAEIDDPSNGRCACACSPTVKATMRARLTRSRHPVAYGRPCLVHPMQHGMRMCDYCAHRNIAHWSCPQHPPTHYSDQARDEAKATERKIAKHVASK